MSFGIGRASSLLAFAGALGGSYFCLMSGFGGEAIPSPFADFTAFARKVGNLANWQHPAYPIGGVILFMMAIAILNWLVIGENYKGDSDTNEDIKRLNTGVGALVLYAVGGLALAGGMLGMDVSQMSIGQMVDTFKGNASLGNMAIGIIALSSAMVLTMAAFDWSAKPIETIAALGYVGSGTLLLVIAVQGNNPFMGLVGLVSLLGGLHWTFDLFRWEVQPLVGAIGLLGTGAAVYLGYGLVSNPQPWVITIAPTMVQVFGCLLLVAAAPALYVSWKALNNKGIMG
ncbi:MAG: hypothetical protein WAX89_03145 [Alphaproteobacteria bacterium]